MKNPSIGCTPKKTPSHCTPTFPYCLAPCHHSQSMLPILLDRQWTQEAKSHSCQAQWWRQPGRWALTQSRAASPETFFQTCCKEGQTGSPEPKLTKMIPNSRGFLILCNFRCKKQGGTVEVQGLRVLGPPKNQCRKGL